MRPSFPGILKKVSIYDLPCRAFDSQLLLKSWLSVAYAVICKDKLVFLYSQNFCNRMKKKKGGGEGGRRKEYEESVRILLAGKR